jgi:hypothetical protein
MEVSGQLHAPATSPPEKSPFYPLDRRVGGETNIKKLKERKDNKMTQVDRREKGTDERKNKSRSKRKIMTGI